jgi:hypothetical protein
MMTVAEMVEAFLKLPQDLEVKITDGHLYHFYEGDFEIVVFEDLDGSKFIDIGVGGFIVNDQV